MRSPQPDRGPSSPLDKRLVCAVVAGLAALRFCHSGVLWVEEAYPMAAARAMLSGKTLYRDIWFDKPPLFPGFYALFNAAMGWPLRLASALFVTFAAWAAWRAARQLWGRECAAAGWAAVLTAFFLTFDFPAAVMALTPDLLALPFHLLAMGAIAAGQPVFAGVFCGIALGFNGKALLILLVCLLWHWREAPRVLAGFAVPVAVLAGSMAAQGSLLDHWRQVWIWGAAYSRDTPLAHPAVEGLRRTLNWSGFHAAIVAASACALIRERDRRWRLLGWIVISLGSAWMGWRFFPRYFFQLLPAVALPAARGFSLAQPRWRTALVTLLAIPLVRFLPASIQLAAESLQGLPHASRDLALFQDSRRAALLVAANPRLDRSALVWGYRPELYALAGLTPGTRFLDSQPLSGVLADRHLTDSRQTFPELSRHNREVLLLSKPPMWILDGLGPINGQLAVFNPPTGLAAWRPLYDELGRTATVTVYVRARSRAPLEKPRALASDGQVIWNRATNAAHPFLARIKALSPAR